MTALDRARERAQAREAEAAARWDMTIPSAGLGVRVRPFTFAEAAEALNVVMPLDGKAGEQVDPVSEFVAEHVEAVFGLGDDDNEPVPLYEDGREAGLDEELLEALYPDDPEPYVSAGRTLVRVVGETATMWLWAEMIDSYLEPAGSRRGESGRRESPRPAPGPRR